MNNTRFEIDEQCPRNIMLVISLIKEDVLSIFVQCGIWLQYAIWSDTVLRAKLLPELVTDYFELFFLG